MATDPVFALLEDAGGDDGLIVSTYTPPILYGIIPLKAFKMSLDPPKDLSGDELDVAWPFLIGDVNAQFAYMC